MAWQGAAGESGYHLNFQDFAKLRLFFQQPTRIGPSQGQSWEIEQTKLPTDDCHALGASIYDVVSPCIHTLGVILNPHPHVSAKSNPYTLRRQL